MQLSGTERNTNDLVALSFIWLLVAGACISVFLLCLLVTCANVWIGGTAGFLGGAGLFFMVSHVLRLTKQPH
jgi:hypothetical protein